MKASLGQFARSFPEIKGKERQQPIDLSKARRGLLIKFILNYHY